MDEQELKTLGRLPELRFLELDLQRASPTIRNISDSDACHFPKLRCFKLRRSYSLVLFVANKRDDKKTVSFHIWDGEGDDEDDDKFQSDD
jgi:disease resistance protein RPM1